MIAELQVGSRQSIVGFFRLRPKPTIIVMNAYEEVIIMTTLYNLFQFGFLLKQQFFERVHDQKTAGQ